MQLLIEISDKNYKWLKKEIRKTKYWLDKKGNRHGDGFCLSSDPEFAEDIASIDVTIVAEITDPL